MSLKGKESEKVLRRFCFLSSLQKFWVFLREVLVFLREVLVFLREVLWDVLREVLWDVLRDVLVFLRVFDGVSSNERVRGSYRG